MEDEVLAWLPGKADAGTKSFKLVVKGERAPLPAKTSPPVYETPLVDPEEVGSKYSRRLWRSVLPPKISQRSPAVHRGQGHLAGAGDV